MPKHPRSNRSGDSASASASSPPAQPDFESSDPYAILGVPRDATIKEIKLSYRKLALKHHPDRQSTEADKEAANKNFAAIGNAYEILGDEGRRREHDEGVRLGQRGGGGGFSRDDFGGFGGDPFSMFDDPFFSSPFGGFGGRGSSRSGRSRSRSHFTDPFELFEKFFAEEMGHHGRGDDPRSSGRSDPFSSDSFFSSGEPFSDPFFSSSGSLFGGGGMSQMMSGHFGRMNSMMSQMQSMHGGFDDGQRQVMGGNGGRGGSSSFFSSSSSFGGGGGHKSVSTSTRTTIVNGVRKTIKERTVVHPDGTVDRHVEEIGGDGDDYGRISSGSHPALTDGRKRRSRR